MQWIRDSWAIERTTASAAWHAAAGLVCLAGLVLLAAGPAAAQMPGTVWGQIFDAYTGEPLEDVLIVFTDPESPNFREEFRSGRNGRVRIRLQNVVKDERSGFTVELKKEGYLDRTLRNVRIPAGQETRISHLSGADDWSLTSVEDARLDATGNRAQAGNPQGDGAPTEAPDVDQEALARGNAMALYNQGSNALNSGDVDTAEMLFLNALGKKADLVAAMGGLARVYALREDHVKAVEYAEQVVAHGEDLDDMNQVLYAGYDALGMEDKAAAALEALQAADMGKAGKNMYNKAADLFNDGQVPAAQAVLEQLLAVDPDHAAANYLLGMCYAGANPDKAKVRFEKFLSLAPDHPDADTAREILKYLE